MIKRASKITNTAIKTSCPLAPAFFINVSIFFCIEIQRLDQKDLLHSGYHGPRNYFLDKSSNLSTFRWIERPSVSSKGDCDQSNRFCNIGHSHTNERVLYNLRSRWGHSYLYQTWRLHWATRKPNEKVNSFWHKQPNRNPCGGYLRVVWGHSPGHNQAE